MGQYYRPCLLDNSKSKILAWIYSHDVKVRYKRDDGSTIQLRIGLKLMEHSYLRNPMVGIVENLLMPGSKYHKCPLVWAGDYADKEPGSQENLYGMADSSEQLNVKKLPRKVGKDARYILNWDLKQFVDKGKLKKDPDGYIIHPLPLLTSEGNGRGGGDFRGDSELVGAWARHRISIETEVPDGFTEIETDFVENQ